MALSHSPADDECSRSMSGLVVSCVITVLLGAWVAIHPNIGSLGPTRRSKSDSSDSGDVLNSNGQSHQNRAEAPNILVSQQVIQRVKQGVEHRVPTFIKEALYQIRIFFLERLPLVILFLLVPEYILGWAMRQFFMAKKIANQHHCSISHGFFIVMGGFHVFTESKSAIKPNIDVTADADSTPKLNGSSIEPKSSLTESQAIPSDPHMTITPLYPLTSTAVAKLLEERKIELPSKSEISDRSKSDRIAKLLALLQTTWFIIQCLVRATTLVNSKPLPITKVELVTIGYVMILLSVYLIWWEKPWHANCPIPVLSGLMVGIPNGIENHNNADADDKNTPLVKVVKALVGAQDDHTDLSKRNSIPLFYSGNPSDSPLVVAAITSQLFGMMFAGILCIAWSSDPPTFVELVLWRLTSLSIFGILAVLIAVMLSIIWEIIVGHSTPGPLESRYDLLVSRSMLLLTTVLYLCARIMSLVLAFMSLRSLPTSDFLTVCWTTRIPHL